MREMRRARLFLVIDLLAIGWLIARGWPWLAAVPCIAVLIHAARSHPATWAEDNPTEAAARPWVEAEVREGLAPTAAAGQAERGGDDG